MELALPLPSKRGKRGFHLASCGGLGRGNRVEPTKYCGITPCVLPFTNREPSVAAWCVWPQVKHQYTAGVPAAICCVFGFLVNGMVLRTKQRGLAVRSR